MGLRERKKSQQRREFIEVAMRLIADRGVSDVNVAEIAEAAGASPMTFYNYFGTKDAVLRAAMSDVFTDFIAEGRRAQRAAESAPEEIKRLALHLARLAKRNPKLARAVFESGALNPRTNPAIARQDAVAIATLEELFASGQQAGHFSRKCAPALMRLSFEAVMLRVLCEWALSDEQSGDVEAQMADAIELFLAGALA